jgi:hypothetical protein
MKGIAYAPAPLKTVGEIPDDDFFAKPSKQLWGQEGRDDLRVMSQLGANFVRVYGNDVRYGHVPFLDYAHSLNMSVNVGMSDWPYSQMEDHCYGSGGDCYQVIKETFKKMLYNGDGGMLTPGSPQYHPAIKYITLLNEPDEKYLDIEKRYKMLISAFDGVLDAEKELNIVGDRPQFTVTFTFGAYGNTCGNFSSVPGLGMMANLQCAMKNPALFGYSPRNDIGAIYETRFVNSFNTQNTPSDPTTPLQNFLKAYKIYFGYDSSPMDVFIGEYHRLGNEGGNAQKDLEDILKWAEDPSSPFIGINFFEYQVRYDKEWERERGFGMFELGHTKVGEVMIEDNGNWKPYPVWCIKENRDRFGSFAKAVAKAYGGTGVARNLLCRWFDTPAPQNLNSTQQPAVVI